MLDLRADPAATTPRQDTRIGSENAVLYPLFMDVSGSRCVVVGGGGVASRKVRGLLESGARGGGGSAGGGRVRAGGAGGTAPGRFSACAKRGPAWLWSRPRSCPRSRAWTC